jgi:antitoxin component YwqK of YwqJK toxin-antitoxin module
MIKEYVEVPKTLLFDTDTMIHYLNLSHEYAKTLKPKPTKKTTPKKTSDTKESSSKEEKKVTHLVGQHYKNGQIKSNIKDDILTNYFEDGSIKAQGKIMNEKMNGTWIFNKKGGTLQQIGNFKDDVKNGEWIRYDSKGEIAYHVEFLNGKSVKKYV